MLHIVTTRFMQQQPTLVELGRARLALFDTFCLPTMIRQQANNFLWFVMTDPNLDADLLQKLQMLLAPYPNFYLIRSNANFLTPDNLNVSSNSDDKMILTGDIEMLYMKMFDVHRPMLVVTRLDADDGLHEITLLEIQNVVRQLPVDQSGWQIVCAGIHFEWRNPGIGAISGGNPAYDGMHRMTSGRIRLVREGICVTPGYTFVKHRGDESNEFPPWPTIGHHLVTRELDECTINQDEARPANSSTTDHRGLLKDAVTHNCWKKLGFFPAALRSRTITSAGMSRIESTLKDTGYENHTNILWEFVRRDFGIRPEKAVSTSQFLHDHLERVASDNLKGQW